MFPKGKNIIVCSGKALYALDYKTGTEKYEIPLGDDGIGVAEKIIDPTELTGNISKSDVLVLGAKGVAAHNMETGKLTWATKTKGGEFSGIYGDNIFFDTEKGDYFAVEANSGQSHFFDSRKNSKSQVTMDGKFIFVFEGKSILKVSTR